MKRFPNTIFYRIHPDRVRILSIRHDKRHPNYGSLSNSGPLKTELILRHRLTDLYRAVSQNEIMILSSRLMQSHHAWMRCR